MLLSVFPSFVDLSVEMEEKGLVRQERISDDRQDQTVNMKLSPDAALCPCIIPVGGILELAFLGFRLPLNGIASESRQESLDGINDVAKEEVFIDLLANDVA